MKRLRRKHKNRIKVVPYKRLYRKARAVFAKWIVRRDGNKCFTCGHEGNQAGHAIHVNAFDFSEELNRCQCPRCNLWLHGALDIYTKRLIEIYGFDQYEMWQQQRHEVVKLDRAFLENVIEKYK